MAKHSRGKAHGTGPLKTEGGLLVRLPSKPIAEIPPRVDRCVVVDEGLSVVLEFWCGSERVGAELVASVTASPEALVSHLWGSSKDYYVEVAERLDANQLTPQPVELRSARTGRTPAPVNLFRLARFGSDSDIEFMYISPREIQIATLGRQEARATGVFHLTMSLPVQMGLLAYVKDNESAFRRRVEALAFPPEE